jgi:8-oxo-dGTP pyrophosphatase MutT (NUDIX family)
VLVPLQPGPARGDLRVVFTLRRADLRRHAGEISFPGGRRDDGDASLRDTALREAEEELGLAQRDVSVIGELPATSTFATNYVIHPFVGVIPKEVAWRPSEREVDAVLELPLQTLRESLTTVQLQRRAITFRTEAYVVDERTIWGATARILSELLERLRVDESGAPLLTGAAAPPGPGE